MVTFKYSTALSPPMALKHVMRRLSTFEKFVTVTGMLLTVVGFYYINQLYTGSGRLSWALLQAAFLWFLLMFMVVLTDTNKAIKEELKQVVKQHIKETKVLQEIAQNQLAEMKALRRALKR